VRVRNCQQIRGNALRTEQQPFTNREHMQQGSNSFHAVASILLSMRNKNDANMNSHRAMRTILPWICGSLALIAAGLSLSSGNSGTTEGRLLQAAAEMEELIPELWPLDRRDVLTFALATIGLMVAAGGGIGGGGMLVPVYILVLSFAPKHAIPLSNVTVFGGAVANLLLNTSKRHPVADRPLIDWDLILIMEPLTLTGALIGANINVLLPDLVIILSLVILLNFVGFKTLRKALKMYIREEGWRAVQTDESPITDASTEDLEMASAAVMPPSTPESTVESKTTSSSKTIATQQSRLGTKETVCGSREDGVELVELHMRKYAPAALTLRETILKDESKARPESILTIAALFLFCLVVNLLKGSGALQSPLGIDCGSSSFWMLQGLILVATLCVTLYARSYLLRQGRRKAEALYQYLETDIKWDERSTVVFPSLCTLAGVVAGLFGVGGGLVKAPLLLALGVDPAVASATSATMILFTTFTATTSYIAFGMLVWDYGLVCLLIGFGATLVGQLVMNSLLRRTGRTSYIAFCISGVVLLSALAMSLEWGIAMWQGGGQQNHAGGFCGQGMD
jgi:uncharacterized membrane protein YfcA